MNGRVFARRIAYSFIALMPLTPLPAGVARLSATDLGPVSGFQDNWNNFYRRGRSIVAADFDGDDRVDFFIGAVNDESVVLRGVDPGADGSPRFEPVLFYGEPELAFVASAADYDNDGDLDLFIGCGGLEGYCLDHLLRNDSTPGRIQFSDVSVEAGIRRPGPHASNGASWGDYDRDGDPDLFLTVQPECSTCSSRLWRNNGDGTFTDVWRMKYQPHDINGNLPFYWSQFQHSAWIDADNDGDLDLFFNNAAGPNILYRNYLVEYGVAFFRDATWDFSLPGEALSFPFYSFSTAVADLNNDGWQDLVLFSFGAEPFGPYGNGNGLFLNAEGAGFFNAASMAGIILPGGGPENAMGSQVADLNADGIPDLVTGGGGIASGGRNRVLLSTGLSGVIPLFEDASYLVDFEPPHLIDPSLTPYPEIPPYPYRTHGMAAADVDRDGRLELAVVNGGLASSPAIVREPNRLFHFTGSDLGATLRVKLDGNGVSDSRDAIGARAYVEIPALSGRPGRRVYRTVTAGSGFSAQNELTLTFGLGADSAATRLAVLWPSGCLQVLDMVLLASTTPGQAPGQAIGPRKSPLVVKQGACWTCAEAQGTVDAWLDPDANGCSPTPANIQNRGI